MINVLGVLVDPTGTPLALHTIRITDSEGIYAKEYTDELGNYSFTLAEGTYHLEILFKGRYMITGDLIVNSGTPSPITLEDLLISSTPDELNHIDLTGIWASLVDTVDNEAFGSHRDDVEHLSDTCAHVSLHKSTDVSINAEERKAAYDIDVSACDAKSNSQYMTYSDDAGNSLATSGSKVETSNLGKETTTLVSDEIVDTTKYTSAYGEGKYVVSMNSESYTETGTITVGDDVVETTITLNNKVFNSNVNGKVTSDTHFNDGTTSSKEIVVDTFKVHREGNDLFEVDTVNDTVTIRGSLKVTSIQDEDGNPLDISDGDTIFQVYQYSESAAGPWHEDLRPDDYWRREAISTNGVIGNYSIPYQFRADTAVGEDGDTIYIEFQYSPDGATSWTSEMKAGDAFRRERTVINGVPGAWSEVTRIKGENGDEIEIRSQYSIDGINFWHDVFAEGDIYERRARFVNGEIDSPWSDPIRIVGQDGEAGIPGLAGSGWYTIVDAAKAATFPSDLVATSDFLIHTGRLPLLDDHLFYVNSVNDPNVTSGKRCDSPVGTSQSSIDWVDPASYIDGDMIVRGTLSASRLIANTLTGNEISSQTTIIAGSGSTTAGMNGYDLNTLPAWLGGGTNNYKNWRFWSGASNPNSAAFRVHKDGRLFASNADIAGTLRVGSSTLTEANTINSNTSKSDVGLGNVDNTSDATVLSSAATNANNASKTSGYVGGWTIDSQAIYSGTKDFSGYTSGGMTLYGGGSLHSKQFYIDTSGNAYFKGNLAAAGGTFSGTIYAGNIEGDVTDSLAKSTSSWATPTARSTILTFTVSPLPFSRTIVVTNLRGQTNNRFSWYLMYNNVQVLEYTVVSTNNPVLCEDLIHTLPANTTGTYKVEVDAFASSGNHYAQQAVIHAFKNGSTIS